MHSASSPRCLSLAHTMCVCVCVCICVSVCLCACVCVCVCAMVLYSCFLVSVYATLQACENFMSAAQTHQETVTEELNSEREKRQRLEEAVETIAKQHNALERA